MFSRKQKEEVLEAPVKPKKKEEVSDVEWDKKKILITAFLFLFVIFAINEVKTIFFPEMKILGDSVEVVPTPIQKPSVKTPRINVANEVGARIEELKRNINGLDPVEVASSSPQIQKVLKDMESIRNLPSNEARNTCLKICEGI